MSAAQDLGNLLKVMEPHVGEGEIMIPGDKFATFYACLLAIKRQVDQLEKAVVPGPARASAAPPWGWGDKVVQLRPVPLQGKVS
jgi:hypothetical protein